VDLAVVHQFKIVGTGTVFIDNLYFGGRAAATGPAGAAPTPTASTRSVISVFSDAYTNLADTDFAPNWGQQTVVTTEVMDFCVDDACVVENVLKYSGLNYQGIQFANQDVSGYTYVHIDFWTADATNLQLFLISEGQESAYDLTVVQGEWVSVDIPLSFYLGGPVLTDLFQFKVVGDGTVFIDNLYFEISGDVTIGGR
jgi:hypothetical protein